MENIYTNDDLIEKIGSIFTRIKTIGKPDNPLDGECYIDDIDGIWYVFYDEKWIIYTCRIKTMRLL